MTEITPAILTNDVDELSELFERYVEIGFTSIDIDIAEPKFVGNQTVSIKDVLEAISIKVPVSIGFHLMLKDPEKAVKAIISNNVAEDIIRIYVHQEANIKFIHSLDFDSELIGIVVKAESRLKGLDFYDFFDEVQLMTIDTGKQGNPFIPDILGRAEHLRDIGYDGEVSVDGGVNLTTARDIAEYELDRVSVGSFFQESQNIQEDWKQLKRALNP